MRAEEIVRLHRQLPGYSVGVLVRRNAAVARLIYELRQRGIEASEEGGNPLTDSPAVELVLSLLTLADHPGDTIARFHLANSPLGKAVGIEDHQDTAAALRLSFQIRQSLADRWVRADRLWVDQTTGAKLRPPGPQSAPTTRGTGLRLRGPGERPGRRFCGPGAAAAGSTIPATADVRVMTVHQAKGLQFDIVVLPELDVGMTGQTPQIVVSRPEPTGDIERICRYVPKGLRSLLPAGFQEMFSTQEQQVVEESLCVLYVAMTRAIHALHMIIAPSKDNERTIPSTWAGLLRAALTNGQTTAPATVLYEHGDASMVYRRRNHGLQPQRDDS